MMSSSYIMMTMMRRENQKKQVFLSSVRCERKFSLTLYLKSTYIKNDKNNILKSSVPIKDSPDKLDQQQCCASSSVSQIQGLLPSMETMVPENCARWRHIMFVDLLYKISLIYYYTFYLQKKRFLTLCLCDIMSKNACYQLVLESVQLRETF